MEKDASFLFGGISFNRKKFTSVFDRFKERNPADTVEKLQWIDKEHKTSDKSEVKDETSARVSKKRKRNEKGTVSDSVEWFAVFKNSKLKKEAPTDDDNCRSVNELLQGKKEYYRQLERDAIFRKMHNIHVSGSNVPSPLHSFAELRSRYKFRSYLLRNLAELGFKEPTPIQRQTIPVLLSGRECFACAPTGSGKTFAFVLPILVKLKHSSKDGIRTVILSPTKELAVQTTRECRKLAKGKKLYIRVEFLVLDESDKLFEAGLLEQVDFVVKACTNPSILRSLFSATLPDIVEDRARTIMHDAVRVIIGRKNSASETIKQKLVFVGSEEGKLLALRQSFSVC